MGIKVITAPVLFAVTLAEAKAFLGVEDDAHDTAIQTAIEAATGTIEGHTGRSVCAQVLELWLDSFEDAMLLPRGPVSAVTSVKYSDIAGAEQTAAGSLYTADLVSDPAWVVRNSAAAWPATLDGINAVRIRYSAGYASVPAKIRQAALLLAGHWFANREAVVTGTIATELPLGVEWLLHDFRVWLT